MAISTSVLVLCVVEYDGGDITRSTADADAEAVRASRVDGVGTCRGGDGDSKHNGLAPEGQGEESGQEHSVAVVVAKYLEHSLPDQQHSLQLSNDRGFRQYPILL